MHKHEPPPPKPTSALDGMSLLAIDTDPDENLSQRLQNLRVQGIQVLSVVPAKFANTGREGYVLVTFDPAWGKR
jgi:hypothetical protein